MGFHTSVDVVPLKIETNLNGEKDTIHMQTPLGLASMEVPFNFKGWVEEDPETFLGFGKKREFYVTEIKKDGKVVHLLNESQYEMVGVYEISFMSAKKEYLAAFCTDVGLDPEGIEENAAAQETT